jgi:hypothetical protein
MKKIYSLLFISIIFLILTSFSASAEDDDDFTIRLSRSACFGHCPVYELSITSDGKVIYNGHEYVKMTGTHTATLSTEKINELVKAFKDAGFFSFTTYSGGINDVPPVTISVTMNKTGLKKNVVSCSHCGDDYTKPLELAHTIDKIVNSAQWTGVGKEQN